MISVVEYDHQKDGEWDAFVTSNSRNGGIFHERNFLSYHPADRFNDRSLLFYDEEGQLLGVLPAALKSDGNKSKIVSHPGSSAGGLVYERSAGLRKVLSMVDAAVLFYRSAGASAVELRLAEPIFANPGDAELSYSLWNLGFKIATREISSCVNLSSEDNWLEMGRKKNIFDVRKLQKMGAVVSLGSIENAYRIIANNLDNRYSKTPTHSLEELLELKNRYPDRIDPWLISLNGDILATVVVFKVNKHAVHTFYIAQDYTFAKLQPMTTFFYELFGVYKNLGFEWFNFGISSRAELIKWGILEFKERVGGRATYRESWVLDNIQDYTPYNFE
jgi:hypothetical protein